MNSDFMNNLSNMFNSGNIPDDVKSMLNNFKTNSENVDNTNSFNSTENNSFQDSNESNSNSINPEMLKNIMNMFNNSNNSNNTSNSNDSDNASNSNASPNIDINTLLKMKSIMDKINTNKNDPRSNLLLSLKPYLKESRKNKVEQYVQLFNMTKIIDVFNQNGGENVK